jgi:ABC-type transporter Mla subunit MlaD
MSDEAPRDVDEDRRTPLWVKVFAAVALAVLLLFVVLLLVGGGHGPGRHGAPAPTAGTA